MQEVEAHAGRIDGVYYCPHGVGDGCECRKPKPGLLLRAQKDHGFDFAQTFFVGDSPTNLLAAKSVGCPAILIDQGGPAVTEEADLRPQAAVRDLREAAMYIVSRQGGS